MAARLRILLAAAGLALLLWTLLPMASRGASHGEIQGKIERKQSQIRDYRGRERVLSSDIAAYSARIDAL